MRKIKAVPFVVIMFLISFNCAIASEDIIKPHTFESGTLAKASEVNENFDLLYEKLNELQSTIESITPLSYNGILTINQLYHNVTNINVRVSLFPGESAGYYLIIGICSYDGGGPARIVGTITSTNPLQLAFTFIPFEDARCNDSTCVPSYVVAGNLHNTDTNKWEGTSMAYNHTGEKSLTWVLTGEFPFMY